MQRGIEVAMGCSIGKLQTYAAMVMQNSTGRTVLICVKCDSFTLADGAGMSAHAGDLYMAAGRRCLSGAWRCVTWGNVSDAS